MVPFGLLMAVTSATVSLFSPARRSACLIVFDRRAPTFQNKLFARARILFASNRLLQITFVYPKPRLIRLCKLVVDRRMFLFLIAHALVSMLFRTRLRNPFNASICARGGPSRTAA